jgi:hypothetical protein
MDTIWSAFPKPFLLAVLLPLALFVLGVVPEGYRVTATWAWLVLVALCLGWLIFEWARNYQKKSVRNKPRLRRTTIVQTAAVTAAITLALDFGSRAVVALPQFQLQEYTLEIQRLFYSSGETSGATWAGFFAFVPGRNALTYVNLQAYITFANTTQHDVFVEYVLADAKSDGKWIQLISMEDEDHGAKYYAAIAGKYGKGWPLPKSMDFGALTNSVVRSGSKVTGFVFFAYPDNLNVEAIRLTVLGLNGAVLASKVTDRGGRAAPSYHGVEDFNIGNPSDFSRMPTVEYKYLLQPGVVPAILTTPPPSAPHPNPTA